MQLGIVEGNAVSTIKHRSMRGWKLLIVQPLDMEGRPDGDPLLVIDSTGADRGMKVLISNDGKGARELVGDNLSPVRWSVIGICDDSE
jgi:ethanolamine utilization protein EutN